MVELEIRSRAEKMGCGRSLTTKQLAIGNWQLAGNPKNFHHKGHEGTQRKTSEPCAN
jgi:hypothetical protein